MLWLPFVHDRWRKVCHHSGLFRQSLNFVRQLFLCGRSGSEAAEAYAGNKRPSILVAEDNDINALLARALLTRLGHRPTAEALVGDPKTYMIALTANAQTD